jgi:pimeloyl-ACP methyl ester carboxylesterase
MRFNRIARLKGTLVIRMKYVVRTLGAAIIAFAQTSMAQAPSPAIGMVIMHGKGGSPARLVSGLASALEQKSYLVANLEMPWSANREYDVGVDIAEKEVDAALGSLRAKGANKVFVAGHSQGALFAIYYGGKHPVDGVIAIAPGGNVANNIFRGELGSYVEQARKLVADGKGNEKTRFGDYEGSKGPYTVTATPAAYLSWFDPEGAMNQVKSSRAMNPRVPVLFIAPTNDYPGLVKIKQQMFGALPRNPLTRMYEPDSSHRDAPFASRDEIVRWTAEVAGTLSPASR